MSAKIPISDEHIDFKSAAVLLELCRELSMPISGVMRLRECELFDVSPQDADMRMRRALDIMKDAAAAPLASPKRSMGGLIGGEAKKLETRRLAGKSITGSVLSRASSYAFATIEVNASMGLIVAAPTAGASGVVPGVLLALRDELGLKDDDLVDALFCAAAVGYLAMKNACVAGAVGGCQAEIGVASAMAAAAAVEIYGGTPEESLGAASVVLMDMLGLVCDPVAGLVEIPCQSRNASGAANALLAAEIALAGIDVRIPLDEMLQAMYDVGRKLPMELRETALGGTAVTPTAERMSICGRCG